MIPPLTSEAALEAVFTSLCPLSDLVRTAKKKDQKLKELQDTKQRYFFAGLESEALQVENLVVAARSEAESTWLHVTVQPGYQTFVTAIHRYLALSSHRGNRAYMWQEILISLNYESTEVTCWVIDRIAPVSK